MKYFAEVEVARQYRLELDAETKEEAILTAESLKPIEIEENEMPGPSIKTVDYREGGHVKVLICYKAREEVDHRKKHAPQ